MRGFLVVLLMFSGLFIQAQEKSLQDYFPLKLFFANDEPNPRTNSPTTDLIYSETYKSYQNQFENYLKEGEHFSYLLDGDIKINYELFQEMKSILLDSLNTGKRIVLSIKGFASPLHFSDYNVNISKRRIETSVNELEKNQQLKSFINTKQLLIERLPFGEHSAHKSVNDELDSTHLSVYHMQASYERRVEVELKEILSKDEALLYSQNAFFDAGKVKQGYVIKHQFNIKNLGINPLEIENIAVSCGCSVAETELQRIQKGEQTILNVEVDTKDLAMGKQVKSITVFYANGKSKRFVILVEVSD